MNKVIMMGRLVNDPELKTTPNGVPTCSFRIAVDRNFQKRGEEKKSDYFNVVAWRQTAEFITKWFGKGRMILIEGEMQTRQYTDKNGNQRQFNKTAGTANDTAFNVIVIDMENEEIHAFCYGAGIDRKVTFDGVLTETEKGEPVIPDVPEEIINLIDTVGYTDNTRLSTSSPGTTKDATGYVTTGIMDISSYSRPLTIRTDGVNFNGATYSNCAYCCYGANGAAKSAAFLTGNKINAFGTNTLEFDGDGNMTLTINTYDYPKIQFTGYGSGANLIITANQEIS